MTTSPTTAAMVAAPDRQDHAVKARDVTMDFGNGVLAVNRASFDLAAGRFLTILGPSARARPRCCR